MAVSEITSNVRVTIRRGDLRLAAGTLLPVAEGRVPCVMFVHGLGVSSGLKIPKATA
jgi:hypothetical protein